MNRVGAELLQGVEGVPTGQEGLKAWSLPSGKSWHLHFIYSLKSISSGHGLCSKDADPAPKALLALCTHRETRGDEIMIVLAQPPLPTSNQSVHTTSAQIQRLPHYLLSTQEITDYHYYCFLSLFLTLCGAVRLAVSATLPEVGRLLLLSLITFFSSPSWHVAHL